MMTQKEAVYTLRKALSNLNTADVTEQVINLMLSTKNNQEFIEKIKNILK